VWTIDGRRVNELGTSDQVMQDRRFLAESGVITASVVWDFARGDFAAAPVVGVRGVRAGHGLDEAALLAGAVQRVEERLTHLEPEARAQRVELERAGKRALRSWFEKATGTYPVLQFLLVGLHEPAVATVADGEEAETAASVVLTVDGEVERRLELSLVDLGRLQPVDANAGAEETALPLRVLCEAAGMRPHASHLTVANERDGRSVSLPLAAILDHALLVYGIVDQPLAEEDGGPVRFAAPGEDGATVPQVSRLTATFGAR
jgi:DMSO/TMAO reductase YedYZ molybdopterin-dependent catalytic subunit